MLSAYIYSFFLFILFVGFWVGAMVLFYEDIDFVCEWLIISLNSIMLEFYLLLDWISCLFIGIVMLISSMVFIYSVGYMEGDQSADRFFCLVLLFVFSMVVMIVSPSLVSIMFGWDMLGLVSYCLVIYYNNYSSYYSGMVTVLSNRVGDIGLLLSIGVMMINGSWNIYFISGDFFLLGFIILAAITKSAQVPFSYWLPLAMAAPTPVSSLVHSSTLVTAGVYLVIRFNDFIVGEGFNYALLFISVFTMFMAGFLAVVEYDLKKMIAFSTLSQLGLMMTILSFGMWGLGFFHLLTHAVFKSLLFLCAGSLIHSFKNVQDIRCYGGLGGVSPVISISMYVSVLGLMGFPYMAGFYSKDLILEFIYFSNVSLGYLIFILLSVVLTVIYSFRLCYYVYFGNVKLGSMVEVHYDNIMVFPVLVLLGFSVVIGSSLSWGFFFDSNVVIFFVGLKLLTLGLVLFGVIFWFGFLVWMMGARGLGSEVSSSMVNVGEVYSVLGVLVLRMGGVFKMIDLKWVETGESKLMGRVKLMVLGAAYISNNLSMILKQMVLVLTVVLLLIWVGGV